MTRIDWDALDARMTRRLATERPEQRATRERNARGYAILRGDGPGPLPALDQMWHDVGAYRPPTAPLTVSYTASLNTSGTARRRFWTLYRATQKAGRLTACEFGHPACSPQTAGACSQEMRP